VTSHAPITETTWVAVFDGGRAAVFENDGFDDAPNLRYVSGAQNDNPSTAEQGSDKPGRQRGPGGRREAMGQTDFHALEAERFVDVFAAEIEAAAGAGKFDRLILIAPARQIARFRAQAPQARGRIAGERAGDFAHAPMEEIERAFREALPGKG